MTLTLEKAWNTVVNLPDDRQDLIAFMILEEIQDEQLWDLQFSESNSQLSKVANKVKNDIKAGKIQRKGFGEV